MNVLIHLATGFATAFAITETKKLRTKKQIITTSIIGLLISVMSHGLLDYSPHCYPINSRLDFILSLISLTGLIYFAIKKMRIIIFSCLIGSVLPDIIDLLPSILNKQFGFNLPTHKNIFPWHWKEFSGSIYSQDCFVSNINIGLITFSVIGILYLKRSNLKTTYSRSKKSLD